MLVFRISLLVVKLKLEKKLFKANKVERSYVTVSKTKTFGVTPPGNQRLTKVILYYVVNYVKVLKALILQTFSTIWDTRKPEIISSS